MVAYLPVDVMSELAIIGQHDSEELSTVMQDDDVGRAVRIRWVDSGLAYGAGWQKIDDLPDIHVETCETVGIWMGENDNVVMVGQTRDAANDNWNQPMVIWKPSIVAKEWLP